MFLSNAEMNQVYAEVLSSSSRLKNNIILALIGGYNNI
jgi:hypothetical protein